jgi:hypothetical protein
MCVSSFDLAFHPVSIPPRSCHKNFVTRGDRLQVSIHSSQHQYRFKLPNLEHARRSGPIYRSAHCVCGAKVCNRYAACRDSQEAGIEAWYCENDVYSRSKESRIYQSSRASKALWYSPSHWSSSCAWRQPDKEAAGGVEEAESCCSSSRTTTT